MPPRRKPPASAPPAAIRAAVGAAAKEKEKSLPIKECPDWQLRPVYDLVDKWESKAALNVIAKLMKKYPRSQMLRALGAVCHLRLSDADTAYAVAREVVDEHPQDVVVLQALMFTLRPLGKVHDIVAMYKGAYTSNPDDEQLANQLFMAYIRALDFAGAQAFVVKCKQKFGGSSFKYAHWHALLTYMQAQATHDAQERQLLLDVAVRQLGGLADKGGIQTYEHLVMYLDVLKAAKVASPRMRVDAINMHLERIPHIKEERWRLLLEHLDVKQEEAQDGEEAMSKDDIELAVEVVSEVLEANPDDWFAWCKYLDAAASLSMNSTQIADFIARMQVIAGDRDRGAYLAPLELAHRNESSDPDAFLTFWSKFGHKPVFYADLVEHQVEHEVQATPKSTARGANVRKMRRYLGLDSVDSGVLEALAREYETARELDVDLLPTEPRHADDFILLAVLYLLDDACPSTTTCIANSPSNHTFKLLLQSLYLHLGSPSRALSLFDSLEIKHVQLDTLSHHVLDRLGSLGAFDSALQLSMRVQAIYHSNARDTPEQLIEAMHRGALTKVPEFHQFYRRLESSVNRAVALTEQWRWDVLRSHAPQPKETVSKSSGVVVEGGWADNRDVSVVPTFRPVDAKAWQVPEAATKRVVRAAFDLPAGEAGAAANPLQVSLDVLAKITGGDASHGISNEVLTVVKVVERLGCVVQLTTTADDQADAAKSYFADAIDSLTSLLSSINVDTPHLLSAHPLRQLTSVLEAANLALILCYLHPHIFAHECAMHPPSGLTWLANPFRGFLADLQAKVLDPLAATLVCVRDAIAQHKADAMAEVSQQLGGDGDGEAAFPKVVWEDWAYLQGILRDISAEFEAASAAGSASASGTKAPAAGGSSGKSKKGKKK
ncbi:N-acetyltransferase B complex non catalytic subunit-domain-containing protein [Catenaria anguillulae PL171]|uniref:N-acetyltransferase B complex non catalytic subunit-domain-containing protein n=1 Tax=Catenaria anguillulae PL171 TaxID=765915 RepID=A0A1Y2HAX5_9FUNG|nr:N-acetyltransferase B complex non catalytic subunit-domain-containing protein [Catenaria anguillulae PL171]